ncbi:ATP-binding cassette domain-containing protein [Gemella haemolysans]|jgi:lipoprotein-releasing system ATP-binding protein lolD|uniref:ATP-binding cassette domain-containing protein n=1 Tax=Gemella haemolysans TaxID=1379 RepID=A0AAW6B2V5_9BACL|nr:ATP-binding cassette domain-containing protein [Gemella haemolysans]MDB6185493.1 ATP-binding cassette domain-containing protein [Gemella haemolysans]
MTELNIKNLTYSIGDKTILDNISFSVSSGDVVAVVGKNGVGKTTLLNNILEKLNKTNEITLVGENPTLGYVPQFRQIDEELPLSAKDFVSLPIQKGFLPWLSKKEKESIKNALSLTNSIKLENKSIGTLSGGEKQRVFLAQALVNKPNLLLLDEFTSNLDKTSEVECMTLVKDITKKENIITLCITHELSLLDEKYVDKILYLEKGCFKFISIADYNKEKNTLKLCKHYVGDNNHV